MDKNEFDWATETFEILDKHFEDPDRKIEHQLNSFNNLVEVIIPLLFNSNMPLSVYTPTKEATRPSSRRIVCSVREFYISRPVIHSNGQYTPLLPSEARLRDLTYAGPMFADIEIQSIENDSITTHIEEKVYICKFPIMLGSKYCHLYGKSDAELIAMGECPLDRGGYFIISGGEKVIISQERPVENQIACFPEPETNKPYVARVEVKSTLDQRFHPIKSVIIRLTKPVELSKETKKLMGQKLMVFLPYGERPVPLAVVFRALGVITDQEIMRYLTDSDDEEIANLLTPSLIDGAIVKTQADALTYITNSTRITIAPEEGEEQANPDFKRKYVQHLLEYDFLPHVGLQPEAKLRFMALMVQHLIRCYRNPRLYTDRDKLPNKRLDLPGTLLSQITRYYFQKVTGEIKAYLIREIKNTVQSGTNLGQSIRRIFQRSNIEAKIKYSMATGNWATNRKQANSASKKGVTQAMQTLSLPGRQSHKRRIVSPLERAGSKHEPPRRLHGSQIPFICPSETPEGAQVGTVKNLAMLTHVSIETSRKPVLNALESLGMINICVATLKQFHNNVRILVNGNLVGVAPDSLSKTHQLVNDLRRRKYQGGISKYVSISWHTDFNTIYIFTDGGRYMAPVYRINEDNRFYVSSWDGPRELVAMSMNTEKSEAAVEYLDPYEMETALVAINSRELVNGQSLLQLSDGTWCGRLSWDMDIAQDDLVGALNKRLAEHPARPPISIRTVSVRLPGERLCHFEIDGTASIIKYLNRYLSGTYNLYTHCIVHPSTIFGAIATTIPLPNHNQSPRVAYQCAMGKQALGMYVTNVHQRFDTTASWMPYPHRPVMAPRGVRYVGLDKLFHGFMSMQATAILDGYNQEDSLTSNLASSERGAFNIIHMHTYSTTQSKLPVGNVGVEKIGIPPARTLGRRVGVAGDKRYHAISTAVSSKKYQLPMVGSYVDGNDVLIPKYQESEGKGVEKGNKTYVDVSITVRPSEEGMIDMIVPNDDMPTCEDENGHALFKVRITQLRADEIGDKYASRYAQKGTLGILVKPDIIIYNQNGSSPDKTMNPQAFPSRMTIGQINEGVASKAGILKGVFQDGTAFTDFRVQRSVEELKDMGYDGFGDEIMYDGRTGDMLHQPIYFAPTYYQRLRHMVKDKMHARGLGPIQGLTRQPTEGRARSGGLRFGEMERDCFIGHGAARYLREKFVNSSDIFQVYVAQNLREVIIANPQLGIYRHGTRDIYGEDKIMRVVIPYATHLMMQETATMLVDMKLEVAPP